MKPTRTVSEKKPIGVAGADQPGDEGDRGDHERHARRERGVARRIAAAQLADRRADQQRQRRGDGDDRVRRAAEQPEDEAGEEAGVEPRFGRQAGQRRVADARGQQVGGERQAGDDVRPQPRRLVAGQPADGRRSGHWRELISEARRYALRRRLTCSCASDRASEALTDATSSSEIFSRSRAAARSRASSALASSMPVGRNRHVGDDRDAVAR